MARRTDSFAIALVTLAVVTAALAGCSADDDRRSEPALSEADQRALDRARTMERDGRRCDQGADRDRDLAACRRACELNHSNSCGWLGWAYLDGTGVGADRRRAETYFAMACKGGSGLGCEGLARLQPDRAGAWLAEARTVYRVHCSQRHAVSCLRLARLYAEGLGGSADQPTALTYWQRACALGLQQACLELD